MILYPVDFKEGEVVSFVGTKNQMHLLLFKEITSSLHYKVDENKMCNTVKVVFYDIVNKEDVFLHYWCDQNILGEKISPFGIAKLMNSDDFFLYFQNISILQTCNLNFKLLSNSLDSFKASLSTIKRNIEREIDT